jgi:REP element-mobilizing transposase RayT
MSKPSALNHGDHYHIYNRGNNRETIFREQRNYIYFLKLYEKYIPLVADTFAYCLLPNHYHLLVRVKTVDEQLTSGIRVKNPGQQFGNLFNAYTKAYNKVYQRTGSLFQKPFGRLKVTSDAYFTRLITYIHHNPERHGLIDDYKLWPYSSYQIILSEKPTHVQREQVLTWFGDRKDYQTYHQEMETKEGLEVLISEDFG